ncbi:MAG: ribonuclease III, partial [Clostridia bacterium]|nr:ribonuclease III [Clostridia bacterium]
ERLEFLGDSILGFIIAKNLFSLNPESNEGDLTKIRAALICEQSLSKSFIKLKLQPFLQLGIGEEKNNGREIESILADCFESLLAAIYLDSDLDTAKAWLNKVMPPDKYDELAQYDWKSLLYERHFRDNIEYKISDLGHKIAERFKVEIFINGNLKSVGTGTTKKSAIQSASKKAIK